jgi:hypothetical protein
MIVASSLLPAIAFCAVGCGPNIASVALIEDGTIRGYGVTRGCREGFKIGPLFVDNEKGAGVSVLRA